jgi:phage protein D
MNTRRASLNITYQNTDITADIANDLLSFELNDNAAGSADDISITLKDDLGKWIGSWVPKKGDIIKASIKTENWRAEGDSQLMNCGTFLVDQCEYAGRPRIVNIGAISTPYNSNFMNVDKSKTWQSADIKKIAQSIANSAKLGLYYDTNYKPVIQFIEQSETPDAAFLNELCTQNGLALKVYNNKIVIYREQEYEDKKEIANIDETDMLSWQATFSESDTGYDACTVEYHHSKKSKTYTYTFRAPGRTGNKIYKENTAVSSYAEAERLAKAKMRELNKKENSIRIDLPGNVQMLAASTIGITGIGVFNGKYFIDKANHSIGSGYKTSLELHKVLEGY